MAVDLKFAIILLMCIQFCDLSVSFDCLWTSFCHFALLGSRLGFLLGAVGAPWAPKGPSLASLLLSPFGSLWTPWDHFGHLGLPRGAWDDSGSKMDVQFRVNGSQVARLRTKRELAGIRAGSALSPQGGARAGAPDPTSLAPGARMT